MFVVEVVGVGRWRVVVEPGLVVAGVVAGVEVGTTVVASGVMRWVCASASLWREVAELQV